MNAVPPTAYNTAETPEAYRSLSVPAVGSVVCGLASLLVVFGWQLTVIPLVGVWLGRTALRRIRRTPDQFSGAALAQTGIGLSLVFCAVGWLWLWYAETQEVPHGYTRVAYEELQGDASTGGRVIPARARALDGKKVYVKGYMYPGRQQLNLKEFLISRDNGRCAFCMPDPTPTDLVRVTLTGDLHTDYTTHMIGLGGTLHVEEDPEKLARQGVAYHLEADYIH
jgi:hypothetical protein